jgi:hypothetical protein
LGDWKPTAPQGRFNIGNTQAGGVEFDCNRIERRRQCDAFNPIDGLCAVDGFQHGWGIAGVVFQAEVFLNLGQS